MALQDFSCIGLLKYLCKCLIVRILKFYISKSGNSNISGVKKKKRNQELEEKATYTTLCKCDLVYELSIFWLSTTPMISEAQDQQVDHLLGLVAPVYSRRESSNYWTHLDQTTALESLTEKNTSSVQ